MGNPVVDGTNNHMQSVDRIASILCAFSYEQPEFTLSELARRVGLHRSTTLRLLRALEAWGLVFLDGDKYRLGIKLLELGSLVQGKNEVRRAATAVMGELTARTREMSMLSVYDRGEIVYIELVESPQSVRSVSRLGGRLPAYCTTTGKVLLAAQPPAEVDRVIAQGLKPMTPQTITDPDVLRRELQKVRQMGYAIDNEEIQPEVRGVAAPIRNFRGETVAAVGIASPIYRLPLDRVEPVTEAVKEAAAQISVRLGYRPAHS